jgi:hypothetical protein
MAHVIKEKKKKRSEIKDQESVNKLKNQQKVLTKVDLEDLEKELRKAEQEKLNEEKQLKEQVKKQDEQIKELQNELATVS